VKAAIDEHATMVKNIKLLYRDEDDFVVTSAIDALEADQEMLQLCKSKSNEGNRNNLIKSIFREGSSVKFENEILELFQKQGLTDDAVQVFHYSREYPLVIQMVQTIRQAIHDYSEDQDLRRLKIQIGSFKNLFDVINDLHKQPEHAGLIEHVLREFVPVDIKRAEGRKRGGSNDSIASSETIEGTDGRRSPMSENDLILHEYILPVLKGENPLSEADADIFKSLLETKIDEAKQMAKDKRQSSVRPVHDLKEIADKASKVHLRTLARMAVTDKELLPHQKGEKPSPGVVHADYNSANWVKKVDHDGKILAYVKVAADGTSNTGMMEKTVYRVSQILGMEELFVPTVTFSDDPKHPTMQWVQDAQGRVELVPYKAGRKTYKGSSQAAETGVTLHHYNYQSGPKPTVGMDSLIDATMASLVFGMFDAHSANILINEEGKIKFFDNARSLPNASGFIIHAGRYQLAYRSGLLGLPGSYKPLTENDLKRIEDKLLEAKGRLTDVRRELADAQKELAPGWIESEKIVEAMGGRIDGMLFALKNNEVKKLEDLVMASLPEFKDIACLTLFVEWNRSKGRKMDLDFQREKCNEIGFENFPALIKSFMVNCQLDPNELFAFIDKHRDKSPYEIVALANKELKKLSIERVRELYPIRKANMLGSAFASASFDGKDIEDIERQYYELDYACQLLDLMNIKVIKKNAELCEDQTFYSPGRDSTELYYCEVHGRNKSFIPVDYTHPVGEFWINVENPDDPGVPLKQRVA
jgi:hypothetical protein